MKAPGSDLDRAFSRFARTGDVDALAFVFDQTAPNLTLVATRLVGDGHAAEDLVQQVFLEAIRGAARFRPGAPVLPWLWTILARRAGRHRPKNLGGNDGLSVPADREGDPQHRAISRETVARIAAAVEDLPKPYREVVSLRLLHGLRPTEISTALDRPLGTVHTQMHRGMERLRRALPSGIAGALVGLSGTESLSAGIRTEVLRQAAGAGATGALTAISIAGFASKKLLVAGITTVLLACAVTLASLDFGPDPEDAAAGSSRRAFADSDSSEDPSPETRTDLDRQPVAESAEPRVTFRGRVLAADSKLALIGARIQSLPGPVTALSALEGVFALASPQGATELTVSFPGYLEASASLGAGDTDADRIDLGEIHLQPESRVSVRVLDAQGDPVEDYKVQIVPEMGTEPVIAETSPVPLTIARGSWTHTDHMGRVGPILLRPGRFTLNGDHALGTYPLEYGRSLDLKPHGKLELEIHLRPENPDWTLRGFVVDPSGNPLPGILLDVQFGERPEPLRLGDNDMREMIRSRKDGSFWLSRTGDGYVKNASATFSSREPAQYAVVEPTGEIPLPARDLRIVVRKRATGIFAVRAIDPQGRALDRFGVRAWSAEDDASDAVSWTAPGEQGVATLEDLEPGPNHLWVRGEVGESLYLGRTLANAVEGQTVHVDVEVGPPTELLVEVVDESGGPTRGLIVEALTTVRGGPLDRYSLEQTARSASSALRRKSWFGSMLMTLATDVSDDRGRARLATPIRTGGVVAVRVRDRNSDRFGYLEALDPETHEVRITVPRSAVVAGTVEPPDLLRAWRGEPTTIATLELTREVDYRTITKKIGDVDEHGQFRVDGLEAGAWELALHVAHDRRERGSGVGYRMARIPFATLELRPGDERQLRVDATTAMPGTLRGSVFVDGSPVSGTLRLVRDDGVTLLPRIIDGRFAQLLPRGLWSASLDEPWILLGPVDLAGTVGYRSFAISTARLLLRLVDPAGETLADRWLSIVPHELVASSGEPGFHPGRGHAQTDGEGVVRIDPAPSELISCFVWPSGTRLSLGILLGTDGEPAEPEAVVGPLMASRSRQPGMQTVVVEKR